MYIQCIIYDVHIHSSIYRSYGIHILQISVEWVCVYVWAVCVCVCVCLAEYWLARNSDQQQASFPWYFFFFSFFFFLFFSLFSPRFLSLFFFFSRLFLFSFLLFLFLFSHFQCLGLLLYMYSYTVVCTVVPLRLRDKGCDHNTKLLFRSPRIYLLYFFIFIAFFYSFILFYFVLFIRFIFLTSPSSSSLFLPFFLSIFLLLLPVLPLLLFRPSQNDIADVDATASIYAGPPYCIAHSIKRAQQ